MLLLKKWYAGSSLQSCSLNETRFTTFTKSLVRSSFNLAALPPTEEAARLHSWRAFLQINLWNGHALDPTQWGWKVTKHGLLPITSTAEQAPQELLNSTACKCSKGCRNTCGCRKQGMKCSSICFNCRGVSCTNAPEDIDDVPNLDDDDILPDDETVEQLLDDFADDDLQLEHNLQLTSPKRAKLQ